jgi:ABC-type transport system involved in cytochrome bd biosynthesis fused ATPase/permease subunit
VVGVYLLILLNYALDFKSWSYPSTEDAKRTFEVPAKDLTKIEQQQQHAGSALFRQQIAQDVAVIAGLANLAVAFRLHRGDGDVNVVLVCFILFITIGLLQHISNLTRMMQQYTQQNRSLKRPWRKCKTRLIVKFSALIIKCKGRRIKR